MEENKTPQQKYYEANKEKIAAQRKARYEANKELFLLKSKNNYENNKEKYKEYNQANKEKNKEYNKEYYKNNKTKRKEYLEFNKEKRKNYKKNYENNRRKTDTTYKLKHNISSLIRQSIKRRDNKKITRTEIILGCTYEEFKQHIESLWEPWMNWDNYGNPKDGILEPNKTWDFDHIKPMNEGLSEMDVIKLNHYTNIQPLCSYHNRVIKSK